ncbi:MAG: HAD family hydrolase [Turicibacter sp.]|nr:HAD family hydrolase [Turicibacter sp.]
MKYTDLTIFTDLDGTLIDYRDGFEIGAKNLNAIRAFVEDGGRFAIATGRAPMMTELFAQKIGVNFPCIIYNGCAIVNFDTAEYVSKEYLPSGLESHITAIIEKFPWVGMVFKGDTQDADNSEEQLMFEALIRGETMHRTDLVHLKNNCFKVIFAVPLAHHAEFADYVYSLDISGTYFLQTHEYLFEILPKDVSKGSAIEKLYNMNILVREKTAAIGDYYNDYTMIAAAGLGACVASSPDKLKSVAKYVTCPYEQGAVADFIDMLKRDFPA